MEKQQVREKRIPVFTVLKKGAILKNIFVVKSLDLSSHGKDDAEVEEILLVGHHPDCDILLTLPSISRYHLQIRSLPSRQKLFLTDLSSVHGTWVADQKVEPDACVEVKEGDVIRIGGSTRIYSLHWIPLSRAYDIYVSPLHASTKNLEVAHQHQSQASAEDGDGHLDVTSEGSGSSVPSEDEDTYLSAKETSSLPVPRDNYIGTENLQITDEVQAESTSSGSLSLAHIDGCFEAAGWQDIAVSPRSSPQELLNAPESTEESFILSEIKGEGNTGKEVPIPSTLSAETFEDKLLSDYTGDQENQTQRTLAVRDDVLSELDISRSSSRRLSTSNIWSRRGKDASVLQVRTNKSEGKQKQIGKQANAHLQRKALSGRSIYLIVDHGADKLEPEIFTPDKENLTPSSHMLKRRLREIKDTKSSSSKAMRKPFFDIHVEENLLAQQKPDVKCMSSNSKVKHEPVALKKKAERAPFQPILEKSSSQNQSYTEAPSTASARNNISRGVRSSSNLSDGKNKMRWTIVLDTSSLLDKDSRKTLHLLQGLKGTHLVIPRTGRNLKPSGFVELNETKRTRNVLFRRTVDMASSALDWIEECQVNTKWWIQLQSPLEETKATAPTPPVTPQSNGFAFPFSLQWNNYALEIDSPTSEDEVLECALLYRNHNNIDEKLVLLSNDITLKIKAMSEGVICERALEFYESLKNPLSERKKPTFNGGRRGESGAAAAAKCLKLILLHNSQYGHFH
ncbi:unnamed protein product [Brassica napus]|uniref:(rape) hypothetical protein n=1 Tax=Brassica napus TaxID=3708 RepID=A0A816P483_BRANA|nr:unnamed protein product [Brassica napus]